ncbi:hypothetical protein [Streptomyces sp. NPDC055632]
MGKRRAPWWARLTAHALVTALGGWAAFLWLFHGEPSPVPLPDWFPAPVVPLGLTFLTVDSARSLVLAWRDRRPEPPYSARA